MKSMNEYFIFINYTISTTLKVRLSCVPNVDPQVWEGLLPGGTLLTLRVEGLCFHRALYMGLLRHQVQSKITLFIIMFHAFSEL